MYFKLDKSKKMKRVYLAKSNRANPNLVSRVRQTLSLFDVQIVEFTGGAYTHDLLLSCDELYVIPDLTEAYHDDYDCSWSVSIGKGLYEQIKAFSEKHNHNNIFITTEYSKERGVEGVHYDGDDDNFISIEIYDDNDYINHALITINTSGIDITSWELYGYVSDSNELKDESWVSDALNESIVEHNTWKEKVSKNKFLFLVAKKLAKLKLS